MRKIYGGVAVVAALCVVWLGSAWFMGKRAQHHIEQGIVRLNARMAQAAGSPDAANAAPGMPLRRPAFRVDIRDYRRGLLSSDAQYAVHFTDGHGRDHEFLLQDHLQHGLFPLDALRDGRVRPMLAYSQARLVPSASAQAWFDSVSDDTPLSIVTEVRLGGAATSNWMLAALDRTDETGARLRSAGATLSFEFSAGMAETVGTGRTEFLELSRPDQAEVVTLRDLTLHSDYARQSEDAFAYTTQLAAASAEVVADSGANTIRVNDLALQVRGDQKGDLLDAQATYRLGDVVVDGAQVGALGVTGSVSRLNVPAFMRLRSAFAATAAVTEAAGMVSDDGAGAGQGAAGGATPAGDGDVVHDTDWDALAPDLRAVLAAGPQLAVAPVQWRNAGGLSEAALQVNFQDLPEQVPVDVQVLKDAVADARLDLALSRAMVVALFEEAHHSGGDAQAAAEPADAASIGGQLFDEYAALLTRLGVARHDGDVLALSLELHPADNRAVLNGETMSMEQLMAVGLGVLLLQ